MANPLPPTRDALEARLGLPEGTLEDEDAVRADAALHDATVLALAEVTTSQAAAWKIDAPDVVFLVILKAARREFDNPSGFSQESLGDHSVSGMDSSGVFLTAREIAVIQRAATGRRGGRVGTVRLTSPWYECPEV